MILADDIAEQGDLRFDSQSEIYSIMGAKNLKMNIFSRTGFAAFWITYLFFNSFFIFYLNFFNNEQINKSKPQNVDNAIDELKNHYACFEAERLESGQGLDVCSIDSLSVLDLNPRQLITNFIFYKANLRQ